MGVESSRITSANSLASPGRAEDRPSLPAPTRPPQFHLPPNPRACAPGDSALWLSLENRALKGAKHGGRAVKSPFRWGSRPGETNLWWQMSEQWWPMGGHWRKGDRRRLSGVMQTISVWIRVSATWTRAFVKTQRTMQLLSVYFPMCKFCLRKRERGAHVSQFIFQRGTICFTYFTSSNLCVIALWAQIYFSHLKSRLKFFSWQHILASSSHNMRSIWK